MSKKFKVPRISDKEAEELAVACRMAFSAPTADDWFDEMMQEAVRLRELRLAREQQTRTE